MQPLRHIIAAGAFILACSQASVGDAASVSCDKANSPAEYSICTGWRLQHLDARMSRKFYALVKQAPKDWTYRLRNEQKHWVAQRDACASIIASASNSSTNGRRNSSSICDRQPLPSTRSEGKVITR